MWNVIGVMHETKREVCGCFNKCTVTVLLAGFMINSTKSRFCLPSGQATLLITTVLFHCHVWYFTVCTEHVCNSILRNNKHAHVRTSCICYKDHSACFKTVLFNLRTTMWWHCLAKMPQTCLWLIQHVPSLQLFPVQLTDIKVRSVQIHTWLLHFVTWLRGLCKW